MKGIKPILAASLLFAPAMLPASVTPSRAVAAIASTTTADVAAVPAACAIKTRIVPRTPGWVFAVNFDVFTGTSPVGCLMLYRVVYAPTDFIEVPCKTVGVGNDVTYAGGRAILDGGYVYCQVNIKQRLGALTPPVVMSDTTPYPYYSIIAAATLSDRIETDPRSNPIGYYQPNTTTVPGLGLFVPMLANARQVRSEFNGIPNVSINNALEINTPYTFTVVHDGGPESYTTTHYLNTGVMLNFAPRAPVNFYTNGGAFWIGVAPQNLALTFRGTLDEVIFDPPDGGQPPSANSHQQYLSFAPVVLTGP